MKPSRVSRRIRGVLVTLAILTPVACGDDVTGPIPGTEDQEWRGTIAPGGTINVMGVAGSVLASPAAGNEAVVRWTKTGPRDELSRVSIRIVEESGGVSIRAVYPPGNIDVEVTFRVEVPAGVEFHGSTISGDVEAMQLASDVYAQTISGGVKISTTGAAHVGVISGTVTVLAAELCDASVISGTIDAVITSPDWGEDLEFYVSSGSARVEIPSNTNARVVLNSVSGSITTDFPLSGTSHTMSGTLGDGGPTLAISVISGTLVLRAGPPAF